MMQGNLDLWSGYLRRWSRYHFQIRQSTLLFGPDKSKLESRIHLEIAQIATTVEDPVCLLIHTGTQTLMLRADSIQERVLWYKKLKAIQKKASESNYIKQLSNLSTKSNQLDLLEQLNVELWRYHADLENTIDLLMQRIKNTGFKPLADKIRSTVHEIKYKNSEALKIIEQIIRDNKVRSHPYTQPELIEDSYANETKFMSFSHQNGNIKHQSLTTPWAENKLSQPHARKGSDEHSFLRKSPVDYRNLEFSNVEEFTPSNSMVLAKNKCQLKHNLVSANIVYTDIVKRITKDATRDCLPAKFTPEDKFPVMSVLSGVGTDLTRFSFPVTMNEPFSVLQKGCQRMYYSELLNQADLQTQPYERMMYIAAFLVSQCSFSDSRFKKPFNPLLGQTFEFLDHQRNFEYLSEQISHHPPISAIHVRSDSFEFLDNSKSKTTLAKLNIKVVPESRGKIILGKFQDEYVFTKPEMSLNNILSGKLYMEVSGEVEIRCKRLETTCQLKFKEKGFFGSKEDLVQGSVFHRGKEAVTLKGKWSQYLNSRQAQRNKQTCLWAKRHQMHPEYYYFSEYAMQLNHLNQELLNQIAPTDSRLRPDQRALEYQETTMAQNEKNRLQEKQRARRQQSQGHECLWFDLENDEEGCQFYTSNHRYWEERRRGRWQDCLDIF